MDFIRQSIRVIYALFEELENIGSHLYIKGYINRIKEECNIIFDIIRDQDRQIKIQLLEIQALKAELEMNATIFETINNDVLHMRKSISYVSQPLSQKYVEELI